MSMIWKKEKYKLKLREGFFHNQGVEYCVDVFGPDKQEVGFFKFNHWYNHPVHGEIIHVEEAEVFTEHRRKGIATAAYDLIESHLGIKVHQEPDQQSELAKLFWKSRK